MIPTLAIVRSSGGPAALAASLLRAYRDVGADPVSSPVWCPARVDIVAAVGRWTQPVSSFVVVTAFVAVTALAAAALLKVRRHCSGRTCDLFCISLVSLGVSGVHLPPGLLRLLLVIPLTTLAIGSGSQSRSKPSMGRWVLLALLLIPAVNSELRISS